MDLEKFFSKNRLKKENEKEREQKTDLFNQSLINKKRYIGLLNKFFSEKILDTSNYIYLKEFMREKGPLTKIMKFYEILKDVTNNINLENSIKEEFNEIIKTIFPHMIEFKPENIVNDIQIYNQNIITFTKDQIEGIRGMCNFIYNPEKRIYSLYGYAGTGKTTVITKLIHFLFYKNYINSIVFSAPTNKAVNVLKSKFRSDLDDLMKNKFNKEVTNNTSFDDVIDQLDQNGYKINFLTIHKLLNYKNDFDIEGERIFIKGDKASILNFDLVIVDECSMIPLTMIIQLITEAFKVDLTKKIPKVIFIGDPAQLPPVNEKISLIFAKTDKDFDLELFRNDYLKNCNEYFEKNVQNNIKKEFDEFKKRLISMENVTLKQVMRSNDTNVVDICNEVRSWVLNEIKAPKTYKFVGKKVKIYKNQKDKFQTEWFKKCLNNFKDDGANNLVSNIILTWTNKQTDEYNDKIRKTLYNKENLNKFEIGDLLILTDFYNLKDDDDNTKGYKDKKEKESKKFYTSEQIKVTDIEHVIKAIPEFAEKLPKNLRKVHGLNDIEEKYVKMVKLINSKTVRKYNVWKLFVHKLNDIVTNTIPNTHVIYVIEDPYEQILINDRRFAAERIKELRTYYKNVHKEHMNMIDKDVIRLLWREVNTNLVTPFANVNQGTSISCHRSQGSSFYNVFVDADDILKNRNGNEAKRCLYTAMTRTSNELHILI